MMMLKHKWKFIFTNIDGKDIRYWDTLQKFYDQLFLYAWKKINIPTYELKIKYVSSNDIQFLTLSLIDEQMNDHKKVYNKHKFILKKVHQKRILKWLFNDKNQSIFLSYCHLNQCLYRTKDERILTFIHHHIGKSFINIDEVLKKFINRKDAATTMLDDLKCNFSYRWYALDNYIRYILSGMNRTLCLIINYESGWWRCAYPTVKTRSTVWGGGRKPWKQKGLGWARQGSIRNIHFWGGGVAFGPNNRTYIKKINYKIYNNTIVDLLIRYMLLDRLSIIDWNQPINHTKDVKILLHQMYSINRNILLIVEPKHLSYYRSFCNISYLKIITKFTNIYTNVLMSEYVILDLDIFKRIFIIDDDRSINKCIVENFIDWNTSLNLKV